jgi:hypothetical protein
MDRNADRAIAEYAMVQSADYTCPFARKSIDTVAADDDPQSISVWPLLPACFSTKHDKYEYTLCPFHNVTQLSLSSGSSLTRITLGLHSRTDNKEMVFTNGQACWRGPMRSVRVLLECGGREEIVEVSEPEQCTYIMRFKTCAVC